MGYTDRETKRYPLAVARTVVRASRLLNALLNTSGDVLSFGKGDGSQEEKKELHINSRV
jgi:hypothetical protein